jgi:hypothetical protein
LKSYHRSHDVNCDIARRGVWWNWLAYKRDSALNTHCVLKLLLLGQ